MTRFAARQLAGAPWDAVLAWWCGFLVLTIAGEPRELARFVPLLSSARRGAAARARSRASCRSPATVVFGVPMARRAATGAPAARR